MTNNSGAAESDKVAAQRPARRSGRNRKATPLVASFTKYMDITPSDDMQEISNQLQSTLGSIASGDGIEEGVDNDVEVHEAFVVPVKFDIPSDLPARRPSRYAPKKKGKPRSASDAAALSKSVTGLPTPSLPTGFPGKHTKRSVSIANADIPIWTSYAPKSSSRRKSKAGSELSTAMKLDAQKILDELGELDDDGDEDLFDLQKVCVMDEFSVLSKGDLEVLEEEGSLRESFRESLQVHAL